MKFLPIVQRELRVACRRWTTYWLRTWVALTVGVIALGVILSSVDESPQTVALFLFHGVCGGTLLYCLLTGLRTTADCISEEKREGTLGLLFLTDLKGYDVVFGKLVANSLNGFYGLLSVIPLACLPLLMGGITGAQVVYSAIALVNTMFLSVSVGICASACFRASRHALAATLTILLLLTLGVPGLGMFLAWQGRAWGPSQMNFFLTSPIFSYVAPQEGLIVWRQNPLWFWQSIGLIHGVAWVCLGIACLVVPRAWQDKPAGVRRLKWRDRWKQWSYGDAAERKAYRARLLDDGAFYWLAARDRLKPAWVWALLGAVVCAWCWGIGKFNQDWLSPPTYLVTAFLLNATFKNWFASEAAKTLSEERHAGTLELLLVTPLQLSDVFHGQWLALRRQFFRPLLAVLVAEIWMMVAGFRQVYDPADQAFWLAWWIANLICLFADLIALFWVGMWMGLASRNPKRAYSDAVGRVLALPWAVFLVFLFYLFLISVRGPNNLTWQSGLGVYFALGIAADIGYGAWARANLYSQFREVATRRFQRPVSLWRRVFGGASERPSSGE